MSAQALLRMIHGQLLERQEQVTLDWCPTQKETGVVNACQHCFISQKQNLVMLSSVLFVSDGHHYRKPQQIKRGTWAQRLYIYTHNTAPIPKAQGSFWKRRQKEYKSQQNRELTVRLAPRDVRSYAHKNSPTCLPKHGLNKDNTINVFVHRVGVGEAQETSTLQKEL